MTIRKVTSYVSDEGFEFTFKPIEDSLTINKTKTGYEARYLVQDDDPQSPDDWDNPDLFLVGYHRDFTVEGKLISKDQARNLLKPADELDEDELAWVNAWREKYHVFKLEAYIHSGVVLALSQEGNFPDRQWDVSQLGLVFADKGSWPEEDKAEEAARSLIKEWNIYLSGDVYGCIVETYDKKKQQIDYDSCWGFYGYEYAIEELKTIEF
jgi:hypothetical protein